MNLGAKQGANVCILDYDDFRAPSLNVLFKAKPKLWLNDYLDGKCDINDVIVDESAKYYLKGRADFNQVFLNFASLAPVRH